MNLTLHAHAAAAGCNLQDFEQYSEEVYKDLAEHAFEVEAILRGAPNEDPLFLLRCSADAEVGVAIHAREYCQIAIGDDVMLPLQFQVHPAYGTELRLLFPLAVRNRRSQDVASLLEPQLATLTSLMTELGMPNASAKVSLELDDAGNTVSAAVSSLLRDGSLIVLRLEVVLSNEVLAPFCSAHVGASRRRRVSGGHLAETERIAYIQAGLAGSKVELDFNASLGMFDLTHDYGLEDVAKAINAVDLERTYRMLDLAPLRLAELID